MFNRGFYTQGVPELDEERYFDSPDALKDNLR